MASRSLTEHALMVLRRVGVLSLGKFFACLHAVVGFCGGQ